MYLDFPELGAAARYKSAPQKIRVLSEGWAERSLFRPLCGNLRLERYGANRPVAGFFCGNCDSDFELKSRRGRSGRENFRRSLQGDDWPRDVQQKSQFFLFVVFRKPRARSSFCAELFFHAVGRGKAKGPVEKRPQGGMGRMQHRHFQDPVSRKIRIVSGGNVAARPDVLASVSRAKSLFMEDVGARGWLLDVLGRLESMGGGEFSIGQAYGFCGYLKSLHPRNNFVREKIRQ